MFPCHGDAGRNNRAPAWRVVCAEMERYRLLRPAGECNAFHLPAKSWSCKTESSRKPVPLDLHVAADLWLWREASPYRDPGDWIFASPHTQGKYPFWPDAVLQKIIRPAALRAGIGKRIGWHTFRHTYSTLLISNGENVKVVQELMRHASSRCTLEVYSQAVIRAKREAQRRVAEMILKDEPEVPSPRMHSDGSQPDIQ